MIADLRALIANAKGAAAHARMLRPDQLAAPATGPRERWNLDALRGRLVELSARGATATLTAAIDLVREAQLAAEPVAWMMLPSSSFYPPDAADSGVDLAALVVVRVADPAAAASAAARLLRSGAFGLVVLDLGGDLGGGRGDGPLELAMAHQGRLVTLAQTHDAAVVCITDKPADAPSLGSLISLRAEVTRRCDPAEDPDLADYFSQCRSSDPALARAYRADRERGGDHEVTLRILKDKQRGPGWAYTTSLAGPPGS